MLGVSFGLVGCGAEDSGEGASSILDSSVACELRRPVADGPLTVATTVAPITSIVANIASGTDTRVVGLVPEGTNSHTYEPPPSVAATLEASHIVFINGLGLEDPTRELADANLGADAVVCELGTAILPEDEWIFDFSFPRDGGKPNPHVWTNPPMAGDFAALIRDSLSAADPDNAVIYAGNYEAFVTKVDALDSAMVTASATLDATQRQLLTYHDAYAYFAAHYGWSVIGAIQPSSFEEPTPREIADLITQVKDSGVAAIFGSEVFPSSVLEQIGRETGVSYVDVLRDDDLLGAPGDPEHSWLGLMRFNYVTMVEALGGDASALKTVDVSDVGPDDAEYPQ
ncbi:MAG: metal ABC transporter substrate-binding protein [Ilumatobacteraceae bacterium]|nr:metal ABC transporter substrate-binding protein [Ilumatobacteraceae bacterium]